MEASNRSSLSTRGTRHLQRSQTALQSMPGGAPDILAHQWRDKTSATIWSLLTTQMSLRPWILVGNEGRKSSHLKLIRLGGVLHQAAFSFRATGSLKPTACFLPNSCTWALLRCLVPLRWRDWNSSHQLGSSSLSAM